MSNTVPWWQRTANLIRKKPSWFFGDSEISLNMKWCEQGVSYKHLKLNTICNFLFKSPAVRLSYGGHIRFVDYNYFVCFVAGHLRGRMWWVEQMLLLQVPKLLVWLQACGFDVFNFIVCARVCVFLFTGLLWELQLGECSSPRAAAGNRGTLPEARPAGLEWGRTDWSAHRSLWLLLLWVEATTHTVFSTPAVFLHRLLLFIFYTNTHNQIQAQNCNNLIFKYCPQKKTIYFFVGNISLTLLTFIIIDSRGECNDGLSATIKS